MDNYSLLYLQNKMFKQFPGFGNILNNGKDLKSQSRSWNVSNKAVKSGKKQENSSDNWEAMSKLNGRKLDAKEFHRFKTDKVSFNYRLL